MSVSLKIAFMGRPAFAVPSLAALHAAGHEIVVVCSQPPRPAGRGQKETPSPVQQWAEAQGINVLTPSSLKTPETQRDFAAHGADVAVVAAYGMILPAAILEATPLGCVNIHPSLLPRWRGAAPIQRTLMAGDNAAGVCIMQMESGLDTGPVLLREHFDIPADMDAGALHDALSIIGAQAVVDALPLLAIGALEVKPQSEHGVTYAHKITKDDCLIDWTKNAREIANQIRALSPSPGAYFAFRDEKVKIFSARSESGINIPPPGIVCDDSLTISCGNGVLKPQIVQRAGKKRMSAEEMLKGFSIPAGENLRTPGDAV